MDFNSLRYNLQLPYQQKNWKEWLLQLLGQQISFETQAEKIVVQKGNAKSIERFAAIALSDNRNIAVLDIKTTNDVKIARNRVALRDIVFKLIDQDKYHGLLVFYHSEDETQIDFRLSFISSLTEFDADGNLIKQSTHPKRFSFVLGANETCTTATYRLLDLKNKAPKFKAFEKQKGISLKDVTDAFSVEALNNEFFKKYKDIHYKRFWEFITNEEAYASRLLNLDEKELVKQQKPIRDFVKKMLGRIVFLHFLQKKGWLGVPFSPSLLERDGVRLWKGGDKSFMLKLFENSADKKTFYSKILTTLFYETLNTKREDDITPLTINNSSLTTKIPFLNGGLFDDDQQQTNHFNFPVEYFKDLFDFFEQYNFTIDENSPEEQEVGIDPEMLGHIFENLLEENKDKGAYYTPKEIVHYMCQESLIQYLRTHLPECTEDESQATKAIETFIRKNDIGTRSPLSLRRGVGGEAGEAFVAYNAKRIEAILDKVKICDPAIGSGAFPMGMLQEIFKAKITLDLTLDKAQVKKDIIQNSIYGVDLEKGAVDIARLRFWLSLVVDEDVPQPLPNLDYKIMQGNSLLESFEEIDLSNLLKDENEQEIIVANKQQIEMQGFGNNQSIMLFEKKDKQELQQLINLYFDFEPSKKHKYTSKQQVKQAINAIVEGKLKAHFYTEKLKLSSQLIELTKLAATIAVTATQAKATQLKNQKAKEAYTKKIEVLEQKITHLTEIVNKLHQWEKDDKERPYFLWHTYFKDVFDKGGFDIVIGNPPYVNIANIKDEKIRDVLKSKFQVSKNKTDLYAYFFEEGYNILKKNGYQIFIVSNSWLGTNSFSKLRDFFISNTSIDVLVKCPSDVFDASVTTVILGFKKNVIEQKTINLLELKDRKFEKFGELSYSDIKNNVEYGFTFNKIILLNNSETILGNICKFSLGIKSSDDTKFIKDKKENEECKKLLRGKDVQKFQKNYANKWIWYRPDLMMQKVGAGPRNKEIFEKGYKILIKDIASSIQATIDYDGYYVNDTLNVIYEIEKKYGEKVITALLNSILINKWFKVNFEAGLHIKINQLQNIPISYDEKKYELLNQLVTKILSLKSTNNDSIYYENKIDALVFHLYGLNEAEMNQVLDTFTSLDTINRTQIQNEYRNITNNKFRLEV